MGANREISDVIFRIGVNVQKERIRSSMSQEQLSFSSGITISTISKLERHDLDNISIKTLVSIAVALGVDLISILY
jgi:transcriptional regulator with XRE-family HTH domain